MFFLEQFCNGNVQQKSYTTINITYKINKIDVEIASEEGNNYYFSVKYVTSSSRTLK